MTSDRSASNRSGCGLRLPQLLIILLVPTLLAVGAFLLVSLLWGRPDLPRGTYELIVDGSLMRVVMDPERQLYLIPVGGGATGGQTVAQIASPTPNVLPSAPPPAPTQIVPTAPPPTATPRPRRDCIIFSAYRVQAGDTLYSISRKFVTSIPLMARYGISSTSLVPGNELSVPVGDPSCCQSGWRPYVVAEGESWFGIAQQCGITTDALLAGNGLSAGAPLYMASVICVP